MPMPGRVLAHRADRLGEDARAAVGQVVAGDAGHDDVLEAACAPTASATRRGSSSSNQVGRPVLTAQNPQARVQVSPRIMIVAVRWSQHSPMFGQWASSQTVLSDEAAQQALQVVVVLAGRHAGADPVGMAARRHRAVRGRRGRPLRRRGRSGGPGGRADRRAPAASAGGWNIGRSRAMAGVYDRSGRPAGGLGEHGRRARPPAVAGRSRARVAARAEVAQYVTPIDALTISRRFGGQPEPRRRGSGRANAPMRRGQVRDLQPRQPVPAGPRRDPQRVADAHLVARPGRSSGPRRPGRAPRRSRRPGRRRGRTRARRRRARRTGACRRTPARAGRRWAV